MQTFLQRIKQCSIEDPRLAAIFILALATVVATIIANFNAPLWYDEAWRSGIISSGHLDLSYAHAPVTLGYFLLAKFIDIFSQTNFSQRLIDYLALAALPLVVYSFAKLYFDSGFAKIAVIVTFLSGYIIENAATAKPYLLDIVLTLIVLSAYKHYLLGKLSSIYFILISTVFALVSLASLFVLPSIAILLFYHYLKSKRPSLFALLAWSASWFIVIILQGMLFIKPQLRGLLHQHWSTFFLSGSPASIAAAIGTNLAGVFGIGKGVNNPYVEASNIFWITPQLRLFGRPVVGIEPIFEILFLGLFVYGFYTHRKRHGSDLSIALFTMFIFELMASLAQLYPFGDARPNVFSLFPLFIMMAYGGYSLALSGFKRPKLQLLSTSLLIAVVVLTFPLRSLGDLLSGRGVLTQPMLGIEANAIYVAAHSSRNDYVLVSNVVGPIGFEYYYFYASSSKAHALTRTRHITYANTPARPLLLPNLSNHPPNTIWLILSNGGYPGDLVNKELGALSAKGYVIKGISASMGVKTERLNLTPASH